MTKKVTSEEVLASIIKLINEYREDIKPKTDKAEKAIEMLDRVHNWLGELIRDGKCDDHCSQCIGASDLADDIWDVLHPENNKAINSCMDTRTRNCDRFNTGDAEADYATAIKKYREETGKVVYNASPRYNSSGDFIIWMLSGKSPANGTVGGTLHQEGKETK